MDGWWLSERREGPRKAHLQRNSGTILQKGNAAGPFAPPDRRRVSMRYGLLVVFLHS